MTTDLQQQCEGLELMIGALREAEPAMDAAKRLGWRILNHARTCPRRPSGVTVQAWVSRMEQGCRECRWLSAQASRACERTAAAIDAAEAKAEALRVAYGVEVEP